MMTASKSGLLALIAALLAAAPPVVAQEGESIRALKVKEVLNACQGAPIGRIWKHSEVLVKMGPPAKRAIQEAVEDATVEGKLCALRALIDLDSPTFAADKLMDLAVDDKTKLDLRLAAIDLVGNTDEIDAEEGLLELLVTYNPKVRLRAARALWRLDAPHSHRAKTVLREFLKSSDHDLRAEGALALAEIGDAETPGVTGMLRSLRKEPTDRGRLADALYSKLQAQRTIQIYEAKADAMGARQGSRIWRHLDEIRRILRQVHDSDEPVDDDTLRAAAARGMLDMPADPHTLFMTPGQYQEFLHGNDGVDPSYGGIGAFIDTNIKDRFVILRPIFGGPAWDADIRGGDAIVAVNGDATAGRASREIIKQVKGPPGTAVVLTIVREGVRDPKQVKVIRAKIVLPTVVSRMLPGKIGYISIAQFAHETGKEVKKALLALEKGGLRGLVIDVRDNPGGLLGSVKQSLTPFLEARAPICTIRGRAFRAEKHFSSAPDRPRRYPISILVNGRSASGAELMSGVLQHYSKSSGIGSAENPYLDVLVLGEPSFGKGTVQHTIPLVSWSGERFTDRPRQNGRWGPPERYQDGNGNGRWDPGEPFIDLALLNSRWDDAEPWKDGNGNGKWDEGESYTDENGNGKWDAAEEFVDANANQHYDYGAAIKLTVARYYLPDGRNFTRTRVFDEEARVYTYKGGVVPDIAVKNPRLPIHSLVEFREIQEKGVFSDYVTARWPEHKETFRELARFDGRDPSRYPGFDAFHASLKTHLTEQEVRRAIRIEVRRAVSNEIGKEIFGDLSDDHVLRRGVMEILRRLGVDPESLPEYRELGEAVAEK